VRSPVANQNLFSRTIRQPFRQHAAGEPAPTIK
jgi:hypothetical protein